MVFDKHKYYLGPSRWSQKLLSKLPFNQLFNKAAFKHDISYGKGGDKIKKKEVDKTFLDDMLSECYGYIHRILFAYIYFLLVHLFGFLYFNWK